MDYRKPAVFGENWSPERYQVLPYFAAEREALQHAQQDEHDRRDEADRIVARETADEERRQAHDHDRHQGAFPEDMVC